MVLARVFRLIILFISISTFYVEIILKLMLKPQVQWCVLVYSNSFCLYLPKIFY